MRSDYAASFHPPMFGLLLQFVLHVDRPAADNELARIEAVADLQASVLFQPDLHPPPLEDQRLPLDPDDGNIALPDDGFDRYRKRALAVADRDLEASKHLGFERTVWIG